MNAARAVSAAASESSAPPEGTVERWAWNYITTDSLSGKCSPPPLPEIWEDAPPKRNVSPPGRPPELDVITRAKRTRGLEGALGRARALHTFFHHELQAAELMAWAMLAFPDAPRAFRLGLLRIAEDEVRHMSFYASGIERLGFHVGQFPVRDWFWERLPLSETPASFVATMGLGFESANLEHSIDFAARFRNAGDEESAALQELVGREEVAHVRFAAKWFKHFTGDLTFTAWKDSLAGDFSPLLMRGRTLAKETRLRAGFPEAFIEELEAWRPDSPGS